MCLSRVSIPSSLSIVTPRSGWFSHQDLGRGCVVHPSHPPPPSSSPLSISQTSHLAYPVIQVKLYVNKTFVVCQVCMSGISSLTVVSGQAWPKRCVIMMHRGQTRRWRGRPAACISLSFHCTHSTRLLCRKWSSAGEPPAVLNMWSQQLLGSMSPMAHTDYSVIKQPSAEKLVTCDTMRRFMWHMDQESVHALVLAIVKQAQTS